MDSLIPLFVISTALLLFLVLGLSLYICYIRGSWTRLRQDFNHMLAERRELPELPMHPEHPVQPVSVVSVNWEPSIVTVVTMESDDSMVTPDPVATETAVTMTRETQNVAGVSIDPDTLDLDCTICMHPLGECLVLPCRHRYHTSCIVDWFAKQHAQGDLHNCPTCRYVYPISGHRITPYQIVTTEGTLCYKGRAAPYEPLLLRRSETE